MDWLQALILGLVQGFTEYLPVSSSGHLELGKILLGPEAEAGGLTFDIVVHVATVLSTVVILWKEIAWIVTGFFKFKWNDEMKYVVNILISMIPVGVVGLCLKDSIEALYTDNVIVVVGCCLLVTSLLLALTHFYQPKEKEHISRTHAFIIGVAQAVAVLPGLSRSGSTIATGLLLGNSRKSLAQFSFLMVLIPILGEAFLEIVGGEVGASSVGLLPLAVGFIAAFISGVFACRVMIALVKKAKLKWFALYCAVVGVLVIVFTLV